MRWLAMIQADARFQLRHGFYYAYLFICGVYAAALQLVPEEYKEVTAAGLTFSDPSALGLLFAGGIVLLERGQGIYDSLFATPLNAKEYLAGKAASLGLLSLVTAFMIHLSGAGMPDRPLSFAAGVLLTSVLFTLLGIMLAVKSRSINGFIILSQVVSAAFLLPLLGTFEIWSSVIWYALPTQGTLLLLGLTDGPVGSPETLYALLILLLWDVVFFVMAYRVFNKTIVERSGGEAS